MSPALRLHTALGAFLLAGAAWLAAPGCGSTSSAPSCGGDTDCEASEHCNPADDQCTPCTQECPVSTLECLAGQARFCEAFGNGCTRFTAWTACPGGTCRDTERCASCADECAEAGLTECASGEIRTCALQAEGCLGFSGWTTCPEGVCADAESCGGCTQGCPAVNDTECSGGQTRTCVADGLGCRSWSAWSDCSTGACADGQVCDACADDCTAAGETECAAGQSRACELVGSSCLQLTGWTACPTGTCADASSCEPCVSDCAQAGATECVAGQSRTCAQHSAGCLRWSSWTDCAESFCEDPQTCGAVTDLTISASQELCGEHHVGALTIQGGATVTCATGSLVVFAQEIYIDPASSIDVSGVSDQSSGIAGVKCRDLCDCQPAWVGGSGGGSATAGESTLNTTASKRPYDVPNHGGCYASCWDYTCPGKAGGAARGAATDLSVPLGGRGGDGCDSYPFSGTTCYATDVVAGGRGGGSLMLVASDSITLLGALHADGEDGPAGAYSGAGGGAGGSVLVAAPVITFGGTITAVAGAAGTGSKPVYGTNYGHGGAGSVGTVKILYGDTFTDTGTVSAGSQRIDSVSPPFGFFSLTHPRSTQAYNDDFQQVDLTWAAPFTAPLGYYLLLSQNAVEAVTPTNGQYCGQASTSLPAADFTTSGRWYLHAISVDAGSNVGTVASRFDVAINASPHAVTSSSHPDPNLWYAQTAVMMEWAAPSGLPASYFDDHTFLYRVDRTSDTPPGQGAWTATSNLQVLVTQDSAGAPLTDWAYYFHLVSLDSEGRPTKEAAHFRIQLGAEPATTSLFGYVEDPSQAPIAGAVVTLEPYGFEVVTDSNGYFLVPSLYEGAYDFVVTASGYQTYATVLSVNAGLSPLTVPLTP